MRKKAFLFLFPLLLALCACASGEVIISEVMASNGTYVNGESYDWVELYNDSKTTVDLSGWYLSNKESKPLKWQFPAGTKLKGQSYLLVYCTGEAHDPGKNSTFYTDFAISASGASIVLTQADGVTTHQILTIPAQYGNIAWGLPQGGSEYLFLESDTPGKENASFGSLTRAGKPVLSEQGGFFTAPVTVSCSAENGDVLRYTTDGTTPTAKSNLFPAEGLPISKTTALRVRAFREGAIPGETVSATYLMNEGDVSPVICLVTDDKYLFNTKTGALVKGNGSTANYERNWEYPVNIEYFTAEGVCQINQMGSFRVSGHSARVNAQKSIAIYARKALGGLGSFEFNPFPNRNYTEYKSLLLRSANSDAYSTRLRDPFISSLAEGLDILYQDSVCITVYINGKYWGHYNLRENINKYFIAQYEGVTDEDEIEAIDILKRTGSDAYIENGDNDDWVALCDYCKTTDLNDPEALAYVAAQLDVDSLFTHAAFEMLVGNYDVTNVRVYRVPGGKWKYLLFDVEAGFMGMKEDPIPNYIKSVSAKVSAFRHEPLNALLAVPEMRAAFLTRFAEVIEHSFLWPDVSAKLEYRKEQLLPLLERHIARWKNLKMSDWKDNVNAVAYYARVRPKKVISMLASRMKLTNDEVQQYFGHTLELLETYNTK